MNYSIEPKKLENLVELYCSFYRGQELKYLHFLGGEQELYKSLQTSPFQGISQDSVQQRKAWFGTNQSQAKKTVSYIQAFISPLNYLFFKVLLMVSSIQLLQGFLLGLSQITIPYLEGLTAFIITIISYITLSLSQLSNISYRKKFQQYKSPAGLCQVWRDNSLIQISSQQLVVGDIVQLSEESKTYADGWIIEGSVTVQEEKVQTCVKKSMKECVNLITRRMTITRSKNLIQLMASEKQLPQQRKVAYPSPVILSGSQVISGQGKMIVICVGRSSKQGHFAELIHQQNLPSKTQIENKIDDVTQQAIKIAILVLLVTLLIGIGRILLETFFKSAWSTLQWKDLLYQIMTILNIINIGCPMGIVIGLALGLHYIRLLMIFKSGIVPKRAINCQSMGGMNIICYEKLQKDEDYFIVKQIWNQESEQVANTEGEAARHQQSASDLKIQKNSIFQFHLQEALIKRQQQLSQQNKCSDKINEALDNFYQYKYNNQALNSSNPLKKSYLYHIGAVSNQYQINKRYKYVRGPAEEMIKKISKILSKSTGEITPITAEITTQIISCIQKMEEKLQQPIILAFKEQNYEDVIINDIKEIQANFVFIAVIGLFDMKKVKQFQQVSILKEMNINIITVSSRDLKQCTSYSKKLGIISTEPSSLSIKGTQFIRMVGGTICNQCKRAVCVCQSIDQSRQKIRKIDEFQKIYKHLEILAQANSIEKYTLVTGLLNYSNRVAVIGYSLDDVPAMRKAEVGLAIIDKKLDPVTESAVEIFLPQNSIKSISNAIIYGRYTYKFIQSYIMLSLVPSLVGVTLMTGSIILTKHETIKVIQFLWINCILSPLLGLTLSVQQIEIENVKESENFKFDKKEDLLTSNLWKKINIQLFFQIFILAILLVFGDFFLPEKADSLDQVIGDKYFIKYSNSNKQFVASGLWYRLDGIQQHYKSYFIQYKIFPRHFTIVFNILCLFHILNFFNFRKLNDGYINIFSKLKVIQLTMIFFVFCIQILCIQFGGSYLGLYPNGLTIQQWAICLGISFSIWIVGVISKLIPKIKDDDEQNANFWPNKSYNLAVRSLVSQGNLADFQIEDEQIFRPKF